MWTVAAADEYDNYYDDDINVDVNMTSGSGVWSFKSDRGDNDCRGVDLSS